MPRVSDIYSVPAGTNAVTNTTISSTAYNAFWGDVQSDLNLPRPIVAGGTGATSGPAALVNLGGEMSLQVVTNYDSFAFVPGSFYSAPGATSAPTPSDYYLGICTRTGGAGSGMFIEARNYTNGVNYLRQFTGTWGAWIQQAGSVADLDAAYVNVAGDTMTGTLNITGTANNQLYLNATGASYAVARWTNPAKVFQVTLDPANSFNIFDETRGAQVLTINSAGVVNVTSPTASTSPTTGALTVAGGVGVSGSIIAGTNVFAYGTNITSGQGGTTGAYFFGNTGTKYLQYDGINFNFVGGPLKVADTTASSSPTTGALTVAGGVGIGGGSVTGGNVAINGTISGGSWISTVGDVTAGNIGTTGRYFFGNTGSKYLGYDGTNFNLVGGTLNCGSIVSGGVITVSGAAPRLTLQSSGGGTPLVVNSTHNAAGDLMVQIQGGTTAATNDTTTIYEGYYSNDVALIGSVRRNGPSAVTYLTTSDERMKQDRGISNRGLDDLMQIVVHDFSFKSSLDQTTQGFFAQQLHGIYPEAVGVGGDDPTKEPWSVDHGRLMPLAVRAIQQLENKLAAALARIDALEAKVKQ